MSLFNKKLDDESDDNTSIIRIEIDNPFDQEGTIYIDIKPEDKNRVLKDIYLILDHKGEYTTINDIDGSINIIPYEYLKNSMISIY